MNKESGAPNCTYKYSNGTLCNRPLTRGYKDKDGEQYCIFHARDDRKLEELKKQMWKEYSIKIKSFYKNIKTQNLSEDNENDKETIIELRQKHRLNYEGVYIPENFDLFENCVIELDIIFYQAMFCGEVSFRNSIFKRDSIFEKTTFTGIAYFNETEFNGMSSFMESTFKSEAIFSEAKFNYEAFFDESIFHCETNFDQIIFNNLAYFHWTTFKDNANFSGTTFSGEVIFHETVFNKDADFPSVKFNRVAEFTGVFFVGDAYFTDCQIDIGKLKFINVTFVSTGYFRDISDGSNITFINCRFFNVSFIRSRIANIVFSNYRFNLAEEWINKEIQEKNFELSYIKNHPKVNDEESSYEIHPDLFERLILELGLLKQEKDKIDKLKGRNKSLHKKNMLLEHRDFLMQPHFRLLLRKVLIRGLKIAATLLLHMFPRKIKALIEKLTSLEESKPMDFGEVRDNYMQLKVNMDRMKDYDLANDFYYGEMEMKRLGEKWYKPKRWFLALYKFLSGYGNNPGRAIGVFFLLMLLFSVPLFFDWIKIRKDINYGSMLPQTERKIEKDSFYSVLMNPLFILSPDLKKNYEKNTPQNISNNDDVMQRNCWDLLSIFFFNITAISNIYKPTYIASNEWASYYLGFVHYFIRPVQIALIILAIRRKVKRGEE